MQNERNLAIRVQTPVGPAAPMLMALRQPSEAERRLKLALRVAVFSHTYSMAQGLGIYPA